MSDGGGGVIPPAWAVPARFRQRVGDGPGRQRAMIEDGHLLLILHDVPPPGLADRTARLFWRAPSGAWTAAHGDGRAALDAHVAAFRTAIHALDEEVDRTHDVDALFRIIRAATPILRTVRHMHQALQQAREGVDDHDVITLRDAAGDLERAIDLTLQDAKNALEHAQAKANEDQARFAQKALDAQHRLNLLAAVFFPVTAIASVVANSMHTGLEEVPAPVFWIIIGAAFVSGWFIRGRLTR